MAEIQTSDGVTLYAERHPPGAAPPQRPAVVFSCAYCTTHENWRGQVEPLLAAGHPVVLWDYRGHGLSSCPSEPAAYSIERVVADLVHVLDWASPDAPVVLAGLSFGGLTSLHFTLAHAERVAALALIDSGPGFKKPEAAERWMQQVRRTGEFITTRGWEAFVTGKAGPTCIGTKPELPRAQAAAKAICAQSGEAVALFGVQVAGPAPPVIDELERITCPALVAVGEHDKPYLRAGEVMAAKLPAAVHRVIPGASHIVNIEAEAAFNALLLEFLAELPAGA